MGMERCYSLLKCLLILFSTILVGVGVLVCGMCGWAMYDGLVPPEASNARVGLAALVAWGGALALAASLALCGAFRSSAALLSGATVLLALTGIAETTAAVWGAQHTPALRRLLRDELVTLVTRDYGRVDARTDLLDAMQLHLHCCGADAVSDWQQSNWSQSMDGRGGGAGAGAPRGGVLDLSVGAEPAYYWVPTSCCADPDDAATCDEARLRKPTGQATSGLNPNGCAAAIANALWASVRLPLCVGAGLLIMHAVSLLVCLFTCLRQPTNRYKA